MDRVGPSERQIVRPERLEAVKAILVANVPTDSAHPVAKRLLREALNATSADRVEPLISDLQGQIDGLQKFRDDNLAAILVAPNGMHEDIDSRLAYSKALVLQLEEVQKTKGAEFYHADAFEPPEAAAAPPPEHPTAQLYRANADLRAALRRYVELNQPSGAGEPISREDWVHLRDELNSAVKTYQDVRPTAAPFYGEAALDEADNLAQFAEETAKSINDAL